MKRTKIVATIGPSSSDEKTLEKMIKNGVNVCRLNFAYGTFDSHEKIIKNIRRISKKLNQSVGILQDIRGIIGRPKEDLLFGIKNNVDYVALSFIKSPVDVVNLKNVIKNKPIQVIAKIETPDAVKNFDKILEISDGIMVARGDLGIQMPQEKVPIIQKQIIEKSIRSAKPVIVATQMLSSMVVSSKPTRAEVSDVANAVIDHTDAVMLSEETTKGEHPVEVVKVMRNIIEEVEKSNYDDLPHKFLEDESKSVSHALADAAHDLAKSVQAKAIVAATVSGFTAKLISHHRPEHRLIVTTNDTKVYNQLSLVWGVEPYLIPKCENFDQLIDHAIALIKKEGIADKEDKIVIVMGQPFEQRERMNIVKVSEL